MKRLVLICASLLIVSAATLSAQTSVTYMPLTGSAQFQNRILFQILLAAPLIEVEAAAYTPAGGDTHPASAACHSLRAALAANVSKNPTGYALIFAQHVVTLSAVTGAGALTGSLPLTLDTPATDGALFSAINAIWSDTAGCITTP